MARPWSRKGADGADGHAGDGEDENVDLADEAHAWWAQRDIEEPWTPSAPDQRAQEAEVRDVLAEHFGADWRSSFGFDPPTDPPAQEEPPPAPPSSPYEVLEIDDSATWEEIVDAHRRLARRHHPDRLVGSGAAEIAAGEDRIRSINAAYA